MKSIRSAIFVGIITLLGLFVFSKNSYASEGLFELRSTTRESYRCFASSILMQDQNFNVAVSCRELIYPAGNTVFTYILWAQPSDGGNPRRLGELGYGRLSARLNLPFNQLFVTTETKANVAKPAGPVVMRGSVSTITFLDRATTPTPTSTISTGNGTSNGSSITLTPDPNSSITPTEGASTGSKIATAFRRAGLAALLALLALIGLVFAITRSKG